MYLDVDYPSRLRRCLGCWYCQDHLERVHFARFFISERRGQLQMMVRSNPHSKWMLPRRYGCVDGNRKVYSVLFGVQQKQSHGELTVPTENPSCWLVGETEIQMVAIWAVVRVRGRTARLWKAHIILRSTMCRMTSRNEFSVKNYVFSLKI